MATQQQSFYTVQPPSLSACWTLENKYKTENTEISSTLKNYFSKICKGITEFTKPAILRSITVFNTAHLSFGISAILSGDKRLSKVALNDIKSNTRIGLIIPNFFNLAVLILSEECMSVMAPDTHQALQVQALNLLEYLFVNPCCYDTNVSPQVIVILKIILFVTLMYREIFSLMEAYSEVYDIISISLNIFRFLTFDRK